MSCTGTKFPSTCKKGKRVYYKLTSDDQIVESARAREAGCKGIPSLPLKRRQSESCADGTDRTAEIQVRSPAELNSLVLHSGFSCYVRRAQRACLMVFYFTVCLHKRCFPPLLSTFAARIIIVNSKNLVRINFPENLLNFTV